LSARIGDGCADQIPKRHGSSGSITKVGKPVIHAEPSISGTIAANGPTVV
jgi:hypothetical protein